MLWLRAMIRFRVWIFVCYSVVLRLNGVRFSYNFSRFSKVDGGFLISGYLTREINRKTLKNLRNQGKALKRIKQKKKRLRLRLRIRFRLLFFV